MWTRMTATSRRDPSAVSLVASTSEQKPSRHKGPMGLPEKAMLPRPSTMSRKRPCSYTISCDNTKDENTRKKAKFMALETWTTKTLAKKDKVGLFSRLSNDDRPSTEEARTFQSESSHGTQSQHGTEVHNTRSTSLTYIGMLDASKVKESRKQGIERRCQFMIPPITPDILRCMKAFKASIQKLQPLNDYAWSELHPRLMAQLPAATQAQVVVPMSDPQPQPQSQGQLGVALQQKLMRPDDVLQLQCLTEDEKQTHHNIMMSLWIVMQQHAAGSSKHATNCQKLSIHTHKLIAQERKFRKIKMNNRRRLKNTVDRLATGQAEERVEQQRSIALV
jgi:hypothetical protein